MKGKLVIGEFEDYDVYQAQVHSGIPPFGYSISIDVPLDDDFISLISKPYDFNELIS